MKKYFAGVAAIALSVAANSAEAQIVNGLPGLTNPPTNGSGNNPNGECQTPALGCDGPVIVGPGTQNPGQQQSQQQQQQQGQQQGQVAHGGSVTGSGNSSSSSSSSSSSGVTGSGNSNVGNNGNTLNGGSTVVSYNNKQVRQVPTTISVIAATGDTGIGQIGTPFFSVPIPFEFQRKQAMSYATNKMAMSAALPSCSAQFKAWASANRTASNANKFVAEDEMTEADFCATREVPVGQADGVREYSAVTPPPAAPGPLPIAPTVAPCPAGTTLVNTQNGPVCAPG